MMLWVNDNKLIRGFIDTPTGDGELWFVDFYNQEHWSIKGAPCLHRVSGLVSWWYNDEWLADYKDTFDEDSFNYGMLDYLGSKISTILGKKAADIYRDYAERRKSNERELSQG
jgi:hypothetical protein